MGLSFPSLDPLAGSDALSSLGVDSFSFCGDSRGGYLVFSNSEDELNQFGTLRPKYVPLNRNYEFYAVDLKEISFDFIANPLNPFSQRSIVDSGTTFLLLPLDFYMTLKAIAGDFKYPGISSESSFSIFGPYKNNEYCFDKALFNVPLNLYPNITFVFQNNVNVNISASDYLIDFGSCYQLGIGVCKNCGIILGDTFLRAQNTIFDRKNKRVGFSPVSAKCEIKTQILENHEIRNVSFVNLSDSLFLNHWSRILVQFDPPLDESSIISWKSTLGILSSFTPIGKDGKCENFILLTNATESDEISISVLFGDLSATQIFRVKVKESDYNSPFLNDSFFYTIVAASWISISAFVIIAFHFQIRAHARELALE